ncbi:PAS domain S-box protein [Sediminibacillus albus]|uniref:PAS domain S-box-containing protein n=1 Tax=Sediminibacillus albus TaxID=407036 RepID=A0A1G8X4A7_9BACI|nr:PAS domain S-box protein [Sediminibacillus albus]SDJ85187.1 PAS domain S-box-containing protein [Sediminibacillus albus]
MAKVEHTPNEGSLTVIDQEQMYRQIVEYSFETTVIHSNHEVLYINQSGADFLKAPKEEIIGSNIVEVFTEDYRDLIVERIRQGETENQVGELMETTIYKLDGSIVEVELYCHPVIFGSTNAIQSIIRDITPRKESERKLKKLKGEVATPLVPVYEGIAVLPLVGDIDEERTKQLLDLVPRKVQGQDLEYLIIDVSGIYNINEYIIEFLYSINSITKLFGVSLIFTGLRPEIAKKMTDTYEHVKSLRTMATVKQALSILTA